MYCCIGLGPLVCLVDMVYLTLDVELKYHNLMNSIQKASESDGHFLVTFFDCVNCVMKTKSQKFQSTSGWIRGG